MKATSEQTRLIIFLKFIQILIRNPYKRLLQFELKTRARKVIQSLNQDLIKKNPKELTLQSFTF